MEYILFLFYRHISVKDNACEIFVLYYLIPPSKGRIDPGAGRGPGGDQPPQELCGDVHQADERRIGAAGKQPQGAIGNYEPCMAR